MHTGTIPIEQQVSCANLILACAAAAAPRRPRARRTLEAKLVEAKSKKDTLKARAKSAATSKQISDMLQGLNSSNAVTAFERMEEKVVALESEAEATLQARAPVGPARVPAAPRRTVVQMPPLCMA